MRSAPINALLWLTLVGLTAGNMARVTRCELSEVDRRFFQAMLDDWATIAGYLLHLPASTVPWILLDRLDSGWVTRVLPPELASPTTGTTPLAR